ncbi:MAG: cytochrome c biogenesis protein CcdA [Planctomycetota bacterium]
MRRVLGYSLTTVIALLLLALPAAGQAGDLGLLGGSLPADNTPKSTLAAAANFDAVEPGQQVVVAVVLDVVDGWHAQSHEPLTDNLIPFRIAVDEGDAFTAYAPTYADGYIANYPLISPETGGDMSVYSGRTVHYVPLELAPDVEGSVTISGIATLQVCDDQTCLAPEDVAWSVTLPIAEPVPANTELFADFDPATWSDLKPIDASTAETATSSDQAFDLFGWTIDLATLGPAAVLLFAFVAGIFFNIVPCVLPVLPLKIISFYETAQHSRAKCLAHGAAFSFGIVLTFAVLAMLIFVFKAISWGEIFSNPYFAAGVTIVLLVAAAYQFGLFTIMLPGRVYSAEASIKSGRSATFGNIAAGAFTAILSTPCTFGFFLAVLVWAGSQPAWLGVVTIIFVGAGMASPYLLLSAFPQVASSLPRSGQWSEAIKQATGFILIAVAAYFVRPLLPDVLRGPEVWWVIWACIAACGLFLVVSAVRFKQPNAVVVTGVIALLLGGGTLPLAYRLANPPTGWVKFADADITTLQVDGPVVVKFTADWCANCQTIEQLVFGTQDQMDALGEQGVALVKADLTKRDAPGWPLLAELNPARAIPFTAVYLPGESSPRKLTGIYDASELRETLGSTATEIAKVR